MQAKNLTTYIIVSLEFHKNKSNTAMVLKAINKLFLSLSGAKHAFTEKAESSLRFTSAFWVICIFFSANIK